MVETSKQLIKYGLFAAVGLFFDYLTLIFLTEFLNVYYLLSVCAGFIVGVAITFILSGRYVFGESKKSPKQTFILFVVVGVVGLATLNLSVWLLTEKAGLNYILSKTISTVFVFAWNFFARRSLYVN